MAADQPATPRTLLWPPPSRATVDFAKARPFAKRRGAGRRRDRFSDIIVCIDKAFGLVRRDRQARGPPGPVGRIGRPEKWPQTLEMVQNRLGSAVAADERPEGSAAAYPPLGCYAARISRCNPLKTLKTGSEASQAPHARHRAEPEGRRGDPGEPGRPAFSWITTLLSGLAMTRPGIGPAWAQGARRGSCSRPEMSLQLVENTQNRLGSQPSASCPSSRGARRTTRRPRGTGRPASSWITTSLSGLAMTAWDRPGPGARRPASALRSPGKPDATT